MVIRALLILIAIAIVIAVFVYFQPGKVDQPVSVTPRPIEADVARRSVVSVWNNLGSELINQGSGIVFSEDGLIITSHHVVVEGDTTFVRFESEVSAGEYEAKVVALEEDYDLALLKIEADRLQTLPLATGKARQGHTVWAMGYPSTQGLDAERMTITSGIISRINLDENGVPLIIQTDAYMTYGSSGGPLYDLDAGGVVGICGWAQHDEDDKQLVGINYAISIEKVIDLFGEYL